MEKPSKTNERTQSEEKKINPQEIVKQTKTPRRGGVFEGVKEDIVFMKQEMPTPGNK